MQDMVYFCIFCYNKKMGVEKHMMNKKKLCIIIVIAIIVTGLAVTFAVLSKSGKHKENVNAESTVNNEKQTGSVTETAKEDAGEQVQTSVTMQFKQSN
jgi:flagellar basal body-associated protein FliL